MWCHCLSSISVSLETAAAVIGSRIMVPEKAPYIATGILTPESPARWLCQESSSIQILIHAQQRGIWELDIVAVFGATRYLQIQNWDTQICIMWLQIVNLELIGGQQRTNFYRILCRWDTGREFRIHSDSWNPTTEYNVHESTSDDITGQYVLAT